MSELSRVPCLTPGCPNMIQPATAARNQGYCGPCAGQRAREAHEAYVKTNRRDVDRFAGVSDPVELLKLMHTPPRYDPLIRHLPAPKSMEELYTSLTSEQAKRLIAWILEDVHADFADEAGRNLAAFTDHPLDAMLAYWLERRSAYPVILFRGAGAVIRDRIIASFGRGMGLLESNHALSALAWIGDEPTIEFVRRAEAKRPGWSKQLHVGPAQYAHIGGWELTPTGRRELTYETCVAVKVAAAGEKPADDISLFRPTDGACKWCNNPLVNLLQLSTTQPPLSAWAAFGPHVAVTTCRGCTCYAPIHAKLDTAGRGHWSDKNEPPRFLPRDFTLVEEPFATSPLRLEPRRPIHAADWMLPTTHTQIGGHPAWVQDQEYLACHDCGQTMMFLAQVDLGDLKSEGVYYAFLCPTCRTTATTYQQT